MISQVLQLPLHGGVVILGICNVVMWQLSLE